MSGIARAVAGDRWAATWLRTVAAMALALSALTPAMASELQVKPPPAWVNAVSLPLDVKATPGSSSGGVEYLLSDRQTRLEAHDRIAYSHYALRAISGEGVEQAAHVQISFDPTYETLALHTIKVHRGKEILSRLDMAQVKLLQREKDLEARIYDGRKTADVTLQDVRVGDVVEYDYTIRGVNPALGDRRAGSYDLQWRVPMLSMYARLLVPEDRSPRIVPRNTTLRPESQHRDGWVDYVWRAQDVPALAQDDDEPGWYDPYPIVQWTEFPDWAAVATWALPLYRADADQGAELRAQLEAIARANADPGERLLATLRFVQREVRYLGIEVGVGSLAPRPPRQVLAHRFGDCKDKVLLTVWMLRALGIEAQPALVNTHLTRGLDQYVPAASLFDHVIVHARIAGREYWLDPTRAEQKGTLANLSQASFGRALVVDATTTGLATMPEPAASVPRQDVHTVLDASAGRGKPVGMQITTIYEGESADAMRSTLADQSRDELQRGYLNFYATYYPDVAVQKPFTVTDDGTANRLTVSEFYVLGDQWKRDDDKKRWTFSISSPEMDAQLRTPQHKLRTGPLALRYPLAVTSVTEIRLHKDWALDLKPASVEDPAFKYSFDSSVSGPVVKTTERLDMLADNVRADAIAAYVEHARKVHDSLGLSLYMPDAVAPRTAGGDMNWPIALLAVFIAAAAAWLMRRLWHWDPAPRPAPAGVESGLRGWLILPTIAVVVAPLRLVKDLFETLPSYSASTWAALTVSGGARYDALWAPYLLGELAANILLLATSLLLLRLFFTRRSSLPKIFIGYLLLGLAVRTLDLILASTMLGSAVSLTGPDATALVREGVSAVLWTWYFLASRRVGATFVERLHPALPATADAAGPSARAPIAEPGDMGEAVPSQG
jgi:transglutaminase-like putative cysteine protease